MKLYDGGRAPNPRRVRVFLAEKGISVPLEQVDLGALAQKSQAFAAINPLQRVPALVLDDGTIITESIAICRYFEALKPDPPLFGRGALEIAQTEMWNRRLELHLLFPISHVFRNSHPAMAKMEIPQVPAWAEANKPRIEDFLGIFDRELANRPFAAGDQYSVADITGMIAIDFMKPAKLAVPEGVRERAPLARGGVGPAERRCMSMRLTIVGCGDAFGSGGRFNTCFWLKTAKATLLVDCGASTPVALKARGLDHGNVDGIILSHLHGDHFGALPFLLHRGATGDAARASARHRRAAGLAGADRGRDREFLSARADQQMALPVRDRGDRAGQAGRCPRSRGFDGRGRAPVGCAVDRVADFRRRRSCSPIPAIPNGPTR